jgi:hypothetical protein
VHMSGPIARPVDRRLVKRPCSPMPMRRQVTATRIRSQLLGAELAREFGVPDRQLAIPLAINGPSPARIQRHAPDPEPRQTG